MAADGELLPTESDTWDSMLSVLLWLPAALEARLKRDGLCHHEFLILWCLTEHRERTHTMSSLAELSRVTPSHLSRLASRLEKHGWLTRPAGPFRRSRHHRLRDRGGIGEVRRDGTGLPRDPA